MEKLCSWMVCPIPYILTDQWETSSGHRPLGFLYCFRVHRAGRSGPKVHRHRLLKETEKVKSDSLEGLHAWTWAQGKSVQLESSARRHNQHRTAVRQLTYQEEQTTLHSLSYPELAPGNPPEPEQGSRKQIVQVHSSVASLVFCRQSFFASFYPHSYKWLNSKYHVALSGITTMRLEQAHLDRVAMDSGRAHVLLLMLHLRDHFF